jgi:transcription initiation factor IIE alpha subunit
MQTELDFIDPKEVRDISYKTIIISKDTDVQRNLVYNAILGHPEGITDTEICILTGISKSSVNARRNELRRVVPVCVAVYTDEHGYCRLNTMWGINDKGMDQ